VYAIQIMPLYLQVGLLTLGPGLTKDKLMQAAGRLRQLGRGQAVHFVGTPDIMAKVRAANSPQLSPTASLQPMHVLQWVMSNTVQATQAGVIEWARQGLHYATTKGAPDRALLDEVLELSDLYDAARAQQAAGTIVSAMATQQASKSGGMGGLGPGMQGLVQQIQALGKQHSEGHYIMSQRGVDEECERELEIEEEEEEEQEVEVQEAEPVREQDWSDYGKAALATKVEDIQEVTQVGEQEATGLAVVDMSATARGLSLGQLGGPLHAQHGLVRTDLT
jgi:hypothetical protein